MTRFATSNDHLTKAGKTLTLKTRDERARPLAAYRAEERERMAANFFGPDPAYHLARRRFVYKDRMPNYSEERPVVFDTSVRSL